MREYTGHIVDGEERVLVTVTEMTGDGGLFERVVDAVAEVEDEP